MDRERHERTIRKIEALARAAELMLEAEVDREQIACIFEIAQDIADANDPEDKMRRKISERFRLAGLAAAVTMLKGQEGSVDAALTAIARVGKIDKKELRNFRERIQRGRAGEFETRGYAVWMKTFMKDPAKEAIFRRLNVLLK